MAPNQKTWRAQAITQERARQLRQECTPAERLLWMHLRDRQLGGLKFRRQHAIGPFILDFYCPETKTAIELDGEVHIRQVDYDSERDGYLIEMGIRVLHLSNEEVVKNLTSCLETIQDFSLVSGKKDID